VPSGTTTEGKVRTNPIPVLQVLRQFPALQAWPEAQAFAQAPQFRGSLRVSAQTELQVVWHAVAQALLAQVAFSPVVPGGHTEQLAPQAALKSSGTQAPPQLWKPVRQVSPQLVPLQVALALGGVGHGEQELVPQLLTLVFATHWPLQAWKPALHAIPQPTPSHVAEPFAIGGGQAALQLTEPQVATE
jgi:hypothetical protein